MPQYQYRVIPAPNRGVKAKGIKTPEDRFSHALEEVMNRMAADGWEYQRAEALPSIERSGLASTTTNWRNVLVFRKALEEEVQAPALVVTPAAAEPHSADEITTPRTPDEDAARSAGASRMLTDNGVEEPSDVAGMTDSLKKLAASRKSETS
ncbi:DUF4177 domain-containing protein [Roseobacter sinensis]|uniref:DUF4177 domain-containing protein n=1 Tax=Roseobacter sinensis TaxID=2931391 RepID=A0ABT3BK04_9RHOB|nr:DUF4177 domain-containing protein [Roseobacter sp. WL0113]MCV3273917.1 DUF4177 domain-containing protein [Roseobacter sp. WL0113]